PRIQVTKLADSQKYDILDEFDTSVTVAAMFDDKDVVHVQCKYDTGIHLNQRTSEIQSPIFGINNAESAFITPKTISAIHSQDLSTKKRKREEEEEEAENSVEEEEETSGVDVEKQREKSPEIDGDEDLNTKDIVQESSSEKPVESSSTEKKEIEIE